MRVLVTGNAGFLGRHFYDTLFDDFPWRDGTLRGCDMKPGPDLWNGTDCRDIFARHEYELFQFDLVIHCAAMVDGRETIEGKPALLAVYNLQLDAAMFEWALRTRPRRIVYFSSSAAYPTFLQNHHLFQGPLAEVAINPQVAGSAPDETYGWVKLTGERIADEVRKAGVPVTVVRPFSGYGSDQDDCYPFPAMIARARRKDDPFVVWGDGRQVRDFVHVDDVVGAVLALVDAEVDGPVNIGTGVGTSMDELAGLAMKTAGYEAPIKHLAEKPHGVSYRVADTSLLTRYYQPQVTLEEGVRRALA